MHKEDNLLNKSLATVKVGEKGQIVIPKDIRKMFEIKAGQTLLLLADKSKGIAIVNNDSYLKFANDIVKSQNII
ncbi:MAG: AbrB/MazE/SpoVT family DNA-binding domain-containing protein [Clostridia bacterium]|nr:AbrB/MazE/SpoVT family DNA-binding domain-containing protein [Clostridia bacterium]